MKIISTLKFSIVIIITIIIIMPVSGQEVKKGNLRGRVTAADDGSGLPNANIVIAGTNLGIAADLDGNYLIRNITAGKREIKVSFVGYTSKTVEVEILPDKTVELDVVLDIGNFKTEDVVITAQAQGQLNAINQQIQSNTIKNVVSSERLQENPDANAAEAIGRLPGISLIRSGGEGTNVVIRGLNPAYSQILIDGIEIPTNNISGISLYALQGVEVFKSITADMEGDAVAGVVNLKLNEAPKGLNYSIMAQGGYNDLNDYWKNYKFVGDFSTRLFDDKLGIIFNVDFENVNRSNQTLSAGYELKTAAVPGQLAPLYASSVSLNDEKRINGKSAATLFLDYNLSQDTKISFSNFFSHTDQQYTSVSKSYNIGNGGLNYIINDVPDIKSELYSGTLKASHQFRYFELNEGISFSQSHSYTLDSRNWVFTLNGTGLQRFGTQEIARMPLDQILAGATDTPADSMLDKFYLASMGRQAQDVVERNFTNFADVKLPFEFGSNISGYVKLGGEYKLTEHRQSFDTGSMPVGGLQVWGDYAIPNFPWAHKSGSNSISMYGMNDGSIDDFLQGQYNFGWYPNIDRLNEVFNWWNDFSNYYIKEAPEETPAPFKNGYIGFIPDWISETQNIQKINQYYYAGYLMGEINLSDFITFTPGIRYEKVKDNLGGWFILPTTSSGEASRTVMPGNSTYTTHSNDYWLPMIHLKAKPAEWFQFLLSFTKTLHRPAWSQIVPYTYVNTSSAAGPFSYFSGNPQLNPELWTNYDAQFALFGNKVGMVSLTGFYKKVVDVIWTPSIYRTSGEPWPYPDFNISRYFTDNSTVLITIPQNHQFPVYIKGIEFEAQTNFWYLPSPFNNITLNLNFTLVNSDTRYKFSKTTTVTTGYDDRGRPITKLVTVDSVYSGPMLNQPKSIMNFSFGYNYEGFNLWLSYQYTGEMVSSVPNLAEFRNNIKSFDKWDLQISQKLPINGLEALFNIANINDPMGLQHYSADSRPTYLESYGWTVDLGFRLRM